MAGNRSSKKEQKRLRAVQQLVGSADAVHAIAMSRAQARLTNTVVAVIAVYAFAFVLALVLAGVVLFPGFVVLLVVYASVRPWRGVAVTARGVLLTGVNWWTGRPNRILGAFPHAVLWPPYVQPAGQKVSIQFAADRLGFRHEQFDSLQAVASALSPPAPPAVAANGAPSVALHLPQPASPLFVPQPPLIPPGP